MDSKIDRQQTYKKYKRKRNLILFLLVIPAVAILASMAVFYFLEVVNMTDLITIFLPLLFADFMMVFLIAPKIHLYKMQLDYARLTLKKPHYLKVNSMLFTTKWIDKLKNDGYDIVQEDIRHMLLCKYYKKPPRMANADSTLVFITIAKSNEFDFYGDEIDNGIQSVFVNNKKYQKIDKLITLQFKKYDTINDEAITEIQSAILYQVGKQRIVNLSFGYIKNKTSVYCLNTDNWYPNKYVFFAFAEFKRLCDVKE